MGQRQPCANSSKSRSPPLQLDGTFCSPRPPGGAAEDVRAAAATAPPAPLPTRPGPCSALAASPGPVRSPGPGSARPLATAGVTLCLPRRGPGGKTLTEIRGPSPGQGSRPAGCRGEALRTTGLSRRRLPPPPAPALAAGPQHAQQTEVAPGAALTDMEKAGGSRATQAPKVPARDRVYGGETEAQQAGLVPVTWVPDAGHVRMWRTRSARVACAPSRGLPPRPPGCRS